MIVFWYQKVANLWCHSMEVSYFLTITITNSNGNVRFRAITEKAHIKKGQNVFIVGIGGGVALTALQICVALGVNVYVSSSDENKIKKAVELGAKGGVNYRNEKWPVELGALIKANTPEQPLLDAIIDQAGGDIMIKTARIMKDGGIVAVYGM